MRPDLVSSVSGATTYEEPYCTFSEGRGRRHRDRIRFDCSGHRTRDHRRRTGRRKVTLHQLQHDLDESEVSCRERNLKRAPNYSGPFSFEHLQMGSRELNFQTLNLTGFIASKKWPGIWAPPIPVALGAHWQRT